MKSKTRIKSTGEVFTPPALVDKMVDELYEIKPFSLCKKELFIDPTCGDGEFLRGIVRKLKQAESKFNKRSWKRVIRHQLFGVDLMWDNVCDTVYYLLRSFEGNESDLCLVLSGFRDCEIANSEEDMERSPEEINANFTQVRNYKDSLGVVEVRRKKNSQHLIEYRLNKKGRWVTVENIVRANSLTEWDFENWCCKCCKSE